MANKLTTQGYFIKRLRDSGYVVDKMYSNYGETDPRAWSVVIDPGHASIFCTCYINFPNYGDSCFEIYDGYQYIPGRYKVKTSSIEVFIEQLVKLGINDKSNTYGRRNYDRGNK